MLSVIGPESSTIHDLTVPHGVPLWAASVPLAWLAIRRRSRPLGLLAAFSASAAVLFAPGDAFGVADRSVLAFHTMMGLGLLILSTQADGFGRFGLASGIFHLSAAGLAAMTGMPGLPPGLSPELTRVYPLILLGIAFAYGFSQLSRVPRLVVAADLLGWVAAGGWQAYFVLRRVAAGFDQIALGLVFFLLAAWISLRKAGGLSRSTIPSAKVAAKAIVID